MPERKAPVGPQLALGFDFGLRRIGLAAGDSLTGSAQALPAAANRDTGPDWAQISRVFQQWHPSIVVVGLPYNVDGSESELSAHARSFASEIEKRFAVPVDLVDERYSSLDAQSRLKSARSEGLRRRRVCRVDIDSTAACVILERWFARQR